MGKSAGNTIPIFAEPDEIRRLVMSMVTDPLRIKRTDPGRPEICNVCQLHRFFGSDYLQIQDGERTARTGCVDTKQLLAERIIEHFRPMRERRLQLAADPGRRRGDPRGGRREGAADPRRDDGRGAGRGRHRTSRERRRMSESKVEIGSGGLGPRERRWLLLFLALGSIYFALLLADRVIGLLGGFASILLILFLAWLLAFVLSPLVAWLEDRLNAPRPAVVIGTYVAHARSSSASPSSTPGRRSPSRSASWRGSYPERRSAASSRRSPPGRAAWSSAGCASTSPTSTPARRRRSAQIGSQIVDQAEAIARVTIAALGSLLLIIFLSLYMLMDSKRILPRLRSAVPRQYRDESDLFERTTVRAFGGFLRAQLILAVVQAPARGRGRHDLRHPVSLPVGNDRARC